MPFSKVFDNIKTYVNSKKDFDEPVHPVGWKDNVEETKKEEEECDTCVI